MRLLSTLLSSLTGSHTGSLVDELERELAAFHHVGGSLNQPQSPPQPPLEARMQQWPGPLLVLKLASFAKKAVEVLEILDGPSKPAFPEFLRHMTAAEVLASIVKDSVDMLEKLKLYEEVCLPSHRPITLDLLQSSEHSPCGRCLSRLCPV